MLARNLIPRILFRYDYFGRNKLLTVAVESHMSGGYVNILVAIKITDKEVFTMFSKLLKLNINHII